VTSKVKKQAKEIKNNYGETMNMKGQKKTRGELGKKYEEQKQHHGRRRRRRRRRTRRRRNIAEGRRRRMRSMGNESDE
jgi:hypothetical protein